MTFFARRSKRGWRRMPLLAAMATALLAAAGVAQAPSKPVSPVKPLPQDSGAAGLQDMLQRLQTTGRLMMTTAHPDDEDGGLLTLESRGNGISEVLLTLNRGEGGQNKIGSNLFDVLGVVRTLELAQADRYSGVEQRFTRVADFGFSKTSEETFEKWQGHDIALGDMVRVIRTFHPDVLVARFSGTERDGHGHHQASSILTREAFRAAADPQRFPEQIQEGLEPWQPKKLYIGNVCPWRSNDCDAQNYTVKINTGEENPALGMSYVQFAVEGLRHQLSQGAGDWTIDAGPHYAFYKLVDSVLPPATDKDGHEKSFFDGIDTSLPGLADKAGKDAGSVPGLKDHLQDVANLIARAVQATNSADKVAPLLEARTAAEALITEVRASSMPKPTQAALLTNLQTKKSQLTRAANLAAGIELQASAEVPPGSSPESAFMAVPGQSFVVKVQFNAASNASLKNVRLELPAGWTAKEAKSEGTAKAFEIRVPANAQYTRPYWHRNDPERDTINQIDVPADVTLPFPPPPVKAQAVYTIDGRVGTIETTGMVEFKDSSGRTTERAIAVAPAFSVMLDPGENVIPVEDGGASLVKVAVASNLAGASGGTLRLEAPANWRVEPAQLPISFHDRGERQEFQFKVFPANLAPGRMNIRAVVDAGGKQYAEGYTVVTRDDLNTFYYYQPAVQHVSVVDVKVPKDLRVGYIMGAGDEIPPVLRQIGINLTMIPAEQLAQADLTGYHTIVLGIRAYDTQKDVAAQNKKLLDFVSRGGTLIVQYNASTSEFNSGKFTPYPATLSHDRVTVEQAPVQILAPDDPVFHYPNQITEKDFDGWVQERGLYFMDSWDSHFKPLLACHDPGQDEQKGGLLKAQYGKGTYIYTGYAFFRQLPAGVPGAVRLYVNLLAAGGK
jgi:LmbE family N-acetylglucosaminyl deacetylase